MSVTLDGHNVVQGRFPNNEVDYTPLHNELILSNDIVFRLVFESNEDLFNLMVAKKWVDDYSYFHKGKQTRLIIKYFPYSQMDREMNSHLFSLKYVAQIINDLKFDEVVVWDPHSNVLPALLNRCRLYYPIHSFLEAEVNCNDGLQWDLLFFPDNGAAKKYSEILDVKKYRFGNKKRNLDTGEIVSYEVIANKEDIDGKKILIVDDMVMGGRTFVEAAKALREMGASQVDLYVTHLKPEARNFYNSKGNGLIDNIYSADTLDVIKIFETPEPRP